MLQLKQPRKGESQRNSTQIGLGADAANALLPSHMHAPECLQKLGWATSESIDIGKAAHHQGGSTDYYG